MGNKATKPATIFTTNSNNIYCKVRDDFNEFKTDLMRRFGETDKGSQEKIDAVSFYGDFREILIIDGNDKQTEIQLLVDKYVRTYVLTDYQKSLINKIMSHL